MQKEYKIHVKGMVCGRCILAIRSTLHQLGFSITNVALGEVALLYSSEVPDMAVIEPALSRLGFSIIEDKSTALIREIKSIASEVYSGEFDFPDGFRFSTLLKERVPRDYDTLSSIFTQLEGITIERYVIKVRTEKVKELLIYTDDSLSDIAFKLNFNSVAHLSRQFKEVTGINTSYFREIRKNKKLLIENEHE
jgi:AraC family transcriptional regulator